MKPKPASAMQRATPSGPTSSRAPSASSTSADPDSEVALRLPCLATAQPAPAAIRAAVVDTLNVARPPPVPAVSSRSSRSHSTGVASARIVCARPAISSSVSPLVRSAMRNAPISTSPASPAMISRSTRAASSWESERPDASASTASVRIGLGTAQEVGEQLLARVGQDGLRMELHALGGQLAVADPHQDAAAVRGGLEAVGKRLLLDDERVVAAHGGLPFEARVDGPAVVAHGRRLAV